MREALGMLRAIAAGLLVLATVQISAAATLERIRQSGEIRLGYRADARPYSYRNERGEPAGYIVDLCREVAGGIAAALGGKTRIEYVLVPATERFDAVRDGRIDMLCDPTSVTLARRELVDFSIPTFLDGASVLSRAGKPIQRFEDLKDRRIGVLAGTTTEQSLRGSLADLGIAAAVHTAPHHQAGIELLTSNRVDAYFADRAIVAAMLYQGRLPGFQLSRQYFSYETYALALPRDDSAFRLLVDRTLARLYRSGRIDGILARTFGKEPQGEMLKAMILINSLPDK
jgi:polar amino acid transport system substrate-binding protein